MTRSHRLVLSPLLLVLLTVPVGAKGGEVVTYAESTVNWTESYGGGVKQARDEGSDLVDALQLGVDKTRAKLEAAERSLQAFASREGSAPQAGEPADAAAAAIARALAARAQTAAMDPVEKTRSQLEGLEQRLEKTRARLAQGRSGGQCSNGSGQ